MTNEADKKDKKRALEKQKRDRQNVHLQHLSRRNPATLESQIQNLKQLDSQGRLPDADRAVLATLEKELRQVKKAKAQFATGDRPSGPVIVSDKTKSIEADRVKQKEKDLKKAYKDVLNNKRDPRRSVYYDEIWNPSGMPPPGLPMKERDEDDSEGIYILHARRLSLLLGWSTDEDVKRIPMPRDTPPAIQKPKPQPQPQPQPSQPRSRREPTPPRQQPKPVEKSPEPEVRKEGPSATIEEAFLRAGATVIEAAPVIRDFQKEAVSIVPTIVKRRPPKKSTRVENTAGQKDKAQGKSLATTVEDGEDDELVPAVQAAQTVQVRETPVVPTEAPLKRPLEDEEKRLEVLSSIPAAPPKRRRMVNAAPDV